MVSMALILHNRYNLQIEGMGSEFGGKMESTSGMPNEIHVPS
jgi:hypothetical protein